MGVTKGKSPKGKPKSGPSRPSSASKVKKTSTSKSSKVKRPPPRQQKTKSQPVQVKKRKKYTEKELNLPKLNMITPVGVQKPRGKKKGKVFVDDKDSMMTILAMVNADKEGQLESKMMKARQLEEIREARKNELEARQQAKKSKLVCLLVLLVQCIVV
ncbi:MAG: 60S ribosomal subunit assembly/export protein [Watsoniomyces obsoletus]|nr:MAG: 60S ribosomal subunit assembly/export protein [Watsoniomyces obsoletus]